MTILKSLVFVLAFIAFPCFAEEEWVTTNDFDGGGTMNTSPVLLSGRQCRITFKGTVPVGSKIDLCDMKGAVVSSMPIKKTQESSQFTLKERGLYYFAITAKQGTWSLNLSQKMTKVKHYHWTKAQAEAITSTLYKVATWTGGKEEVTYDLKITDPLWKLQWTYNGHAPCSLKIFNDKGELLTSFHGSFDRPLSFWTFKPGTFKVVISAPEGNWIMHAAVLKKEPALK